MRSKEHLIPLVVNPSLVPDRPQQDFDLQANCRGLEDQMYPVGETAIRQARLICRGCPVVLDCVSRAINEGEDWGIYGGMSERQFRVFKRSVIAYRQERSRLRALAAAQAVS